MLIDSAILEYQNKMINSLIMETLGHPYGSAVDRLIANFLKQDGISYLYVTYDV